MFVAAALLVNMRRRNRNLHLLARRHSDCQVVCGQGGGFDLVAPWRDTDPKRETPGARRAEQRLERWEVRSYEAEYVHGLWHADFHQGSRQVLMPSGRWVTPLLLCLIDDHSRLVCHLQWYLDEAAETLAHGLCQALQKRALPRALMTDNGAA